MSHRVAILGATGLVGRTMLACSKSAVSRSTSCVLLASDRSADRALPFRGRVAAGAARSSDGSFAGVELALFAVGQRRQRARGRRSAQRARAPRVDRQQQRVPLRRRRAAGRAGGQRRRCSTRRPTLVANPNCSTIAIVLALAPLARAVGLERVVVVDLPVGVGRRLRRARRARARRPRRARRAAAAARGRRAAVRVQRACRTSTASRTTATRARR